MIAYQFQEFIMILVFRMSYKVTGREPQHKLNVVFIKKKSLTFSNSQSVRHFKYVKCMLVVCFF